MTIQYTENTTESAVAGEASSYYTPKALENLAVLEQRVREDLETTAHAHQWVPSKPGLDFNVLIVGGGQAGLGAAFALKRENIDRVQIFEADTRDHNGCWINYARMHTLRSPKHMKGIELDVPSLHIRRWFEAVYGAEAWERIKLIPRLDWNAYLRWYEKMTEAPVQYGTRVVAVHKPATPEAPFVVDAEVTDLNGHIKLISVTAQRVIFALGLTGGGAINVLPEISTLPSNLWAHTQDPIDFKALAGKKVLVVGAGASGYDNAGTALENGAAQVKVLMRRTEVPSHNPLRWMEFPGMQEHFFDLTDEQKWEFSTFNGGLPQPPTQHAIWRCFNHENFELVRGATVARYEIKDGAAAVTAVISTPEGERVEDFDFVISATGYKVDLSQRTELAEFIDDILLWEDVHEPSRKHPMGKNPYLGDAFQFTARPDSEAPWLNRLHHFSTAARASMGVTGNQLSGIYGGIKRIGWSISSDITRENWGSFMSDFREFEALEISSVGAHTEADGWYPQTSRFGVGH
ncbi:NAD(P)-binding domain-containing protein [Rothia aerolata]|uniref:FAD-dependent urate hydroxylase n=1 Tax=Rothia aerolata TaxID=1812262 RepID=A0A917IW38_9MICC|nr:NAD(P)-binding domain-containing protein [Rothia aerolata]GGH65780.1 FAD-dependent urate hydroxylase [Rothia aerolata]